MTRNIAVALPFHGISVREGSYEQYMHAARILTFNTIRRPEDVHSANANDELLVRDVV
jgi:hypothetical protein